MSDMIEKRKRLTIMLALVFLWYLALTPTNAEPCSVPADLQTALAHR